MNDTQADNRIPLSFYLVTTVLLVYVALCTGHRDNIWDADAWEYHRSVLTLAERMWDPGNPTYDADYPSPRYSPYALLWAAFSRGTGISPYTSLSIAAVVNTAILVFGVAGLTRSYGEGRSATACVIVMFSLFGEVPGFTCSYALNDQPWIGVNSSAFAQGLAVWMWVLFRSTSGRSRIFVVPVLMGLAGVALLDHAIIGVFSLAGLFLTAITDENDGRLRNLIVVVVVSIGAFALAFIWPWYDFARLVFKPIPRGMVSFGILKLTLFRWCLPAVICSLLALVCRDRKIVRVLLFGGAVCYAAGVAAWLLPPGAPFRAVLARLPLPGLLMLHIPIGVFAHRYGVLDLRTWPERFRRLLGDARSVAPQAILETVFAVLLIGCLAPQLFFILQEPLLARSYVAPLMGKEDKQLDLKRRLDNLLSPIGLHDVVLADGRTAWPVPSFGGRIVFAIHPEWFADDEPERKAEVLQFFDAKTSHAARLDIISKRHVKWILLNREFNSGDAFVDLYCEAAVVAKDRDLVLMDVQRWIDANTLTTEAD